MKKKITSNEQSFPKIECMEEKQLTQIPVFLDLIEQINDPTDIINLFLTNKNILSLCYTLPQVRDRIFVLMNNLAIKEQDQVLKLLNEEPIIYYIIKQKFQLSDKYRRKLLKYMNSMALLFNDYDYPSHSDPELNFVAYILEIGNLKDYDQKLFLEQVLVFLGSEYLQYMFDKFKNLNPDMSSYYLDAAADSHQDSLGILMSEIIRQYEQEYRRIPPILNSLFEFYNVK